MEVVIWFWRVVLMCLAFRFQEACRELASTAGLVLLRFRHWHIKLWRCFMNQVIWSKLYVTKTRNSRCSCVAITVISNCCCFYRRARLIWEFEGTVRIVAHQLGRRVCNIDQLEKSTKPVRCWVMSIKIPDLCHLICSNHNVYNQWICVRVSKPEDTVFCNCGACQEK